VNDLNSAVEATRHVMANRRGFDDAEKGWLSPVLWQRAAGDPVLCAAAILAAVADVSGYFAAADLDPRVERDRSTLRLIAEDLGAAAVSLRTVLAECGGES
jgi:hypothetical protein